MSIAGHSGGYQLADDAYIDQMIDRWRALHEAIDQHGWQISTAIQQVFPPARDRPSGSQASAYVASLLRAKKHNQGMSDYATAYLDRLDASRGRYAQLEQDVEGGLRYPGGR